MDNASRMTDHNGSTIHFQPGFGVGSISGTPISFEQLVMQLAYPQGAP
jgi:phospholipid/cholesterol/gamma-HCH transport system substrate-binding protein